MAKNIAVKITGEADFGDAASEIKRTFDKVEQQAEKLDIGSSLGSKLKNSLKGLRKKIVGPFSDAAVGIPKEFDGVADRIQSKFSGLGDKIKDGIGLGAGFAVGSNIADTLVGGFTEALDLQAGRDKLAAQLNLTAEESERVGKLSGALYADAYGESMEQVNEAVRGVVSEMADLGETSDEELSMMTAGALDLATAFDRDVNEVIKASGQLMKNGLAKDGTEALDLVTVALQEAGVQGDDVLDTVNEYSGAFKRLGFDGADAVAIMSAGLEEGIFNTDKIGDAFNEFSINAIDGSKGSTEALAKVSEALGIGYDATVEWSNALANGGDGAAATFEAIVSGLQMIEDPLERDAAGVALFGSIWQDLGEDAIFALNTTSEALGETSGAAAALGDTLNDNLRTKIEAFRRGALLKLSEFLANVVIPAIERFGPPLLDAATRFGELASIVADKVQPVFEFISENSAIIAGALAGLGIAVGTVVVPAFIAWASAAGAAAIATLIAAAPVIALGLGLAALGAGLVWAYQNVEPFRAAIDATIGVMKAVAGAVVDFIALIFTDWDEAWKKIAAVFSAVWSSIRSSASSEWAALRAMFSDGGAAIAGFWSRLWTGVKSWVSDAWGAITGAVGRGVDSVVSEIRAMPGDIARAARGMFNGIYDSFKSAINRIRDLWNGLSFKVPSVKIPGINKTIGGSTIRLPKLPFFASGGAVTSTTLGVLGEGSSISKANPEIVSPKDLMKATLIEALAEVNLSNNADSGSSGLHIENVIVNDGRDIWQDLPLTAQMHRVRA